MIVEVAAEGLGADAGCVEKLWRMERITGDDDCAGADHEAVAGARAGELTLATVRPS